MVYVMCIFICKYDLHDIYAYIYIYIWYSHHIFRDCDRAHFFLVNSSDSPSSTISFRKMRDRLKALKLKEDGQVLVGGKEDIHQFQRGYVFPTFCFQHVRLSWSRLLWFFFVLVLHLKMFYYANFCSFITQIHHWHSNLLVQQNFEPETTNIHWSLMNFFFGETTAFFFSHCSYTIWTPLRSGNRICAGCTSPTTWCRCPRRMLRTWPCRPCGALCPAAEIPDVLVGVWWCVGGPIPTLSPFKCM